MDVDNTMDPILNDSARPWRSSYGSRLDRVVLFGSRARGDAHADSDYDVAVFLKTVRIAGRSGIGWPTLSSGSSMKVARFSRPSRFGHPITTGEPL